MTKLEGVLALAAGGARGAYEVGALRALAERGLRFTHVAGTSIGALNGAFYAQSDGSLGAINRLAELWRTFPTAGLTRVNVGALAQLAVAQYFSPQAIRLLAAIGPQHPGVLDPSGLESLLDRAIDYEYLRKAPTRLTVCTLPAAGPLADVVVGPFRDSRYIDADRCSALELRSLLLASAAIPFAFPARKVGGQQYSDAALSDPLPARELHRRGHRRIFSIFLSDCTAQNRADLPGALVFQIRPSTNIDLGLFTCFDFSLGTIERLMKLGYDDGRQTLDEVADIAESIDTLLTLGNIEEDLSRQLPDRSKRLKPG